MEGSSCTASQVFCYLRNGRNAKKSETTRCNQPVTSVQRLPGAVYSTVSSSGCDWWHGDVVQSWDEQKQQPPVGTRQNTNQRHPLACRSPLLSVEEHRF